MQERGRWLVGVLLGHGACGWLGLPTGVMVCRGVGGAGREQSGLGRRDWLGRCPDARWKASGNLGRVCASREWWGPGDQWREDNGIVGCDVSSMVARASRWETAWNGRTRQTATSTGHVWRNRAARGRVSQETALLMQPTADGPVGIVPGTLERSRRI